MESRTNKSQCLIPIEERRRHARAELAASAMVHRAHGRVGPYFVANLSAGGALLIGGPGLNVGEEVRVTLQMPGEARFDVMAEVTRVEPGDEAAYGLAFRNVPPDTEDLIQATVLAALERLSSSRAVLVVDDSLTICRALKREIRALGREAVSAQAPLDALKWLAETPIDTIVADLFLGRDTGQTPGLDLLGFVQDEHPNVRRILMLGQTAPTQLELARTSGRAHAILNKPWDHEELIAVLANR